MMINTVTFDNPNNKFLKSSYFQETKRRFGVDLPQVKWDLISSIICSVYEMPHKSPYNLRWNLW